MKELRDILSVFARASEPLALATIVGTTGSSYRKAGARMLVMPDGRTIGTLSGGCIEKEVAQRALPVISSGQPSLFSIDTRRRFGCHGSIQFLIERIEPGNEFLNYLTACFVQRRPAHVRVVFDWAVESGTFPLASAVPGIEGFDETIPPPIRLVVVGEGPGSDALLGFARLLGWDALLLDQTEAAAGLQPEPRTAMIIKNHHFGRDFAALRWALIQPFGYVGLLGSHQRKGELLNALIGEGWVPANAGLRHFYGPAGLDLGAELPEEIALSIIAEIQAVMAHHEGGFLRDRQKPIHEVLCPTAAHSF